MSTIQIINSNLLDEQLFTCQAVCKWFDNFPGCEVEDKSECNRNRKCRQCFLENGY
jgi:hypothetical protein